MSDRGREPDRQAPAFLRIVIAHDVGGFVQVMEHDFGAIEQSGASRRQSDAAAVPNEQRDLQFLLKPRDLATESRLSNSQLLGRPAEAPRVGDHSEGTKFAKIHSIHTAECMSYVDMAYQSIKKRFLI
ncbi:hypothetical protein IWY39_004574 [Sphingobium sp. JAI105]|nr:MULTISPECIES: hypothetical protein [unclassified Sphingobium]MBG6120709.1 hypothetical protein [Sphingobium sp. JAI105]